MTPITPRRTLVRRSVSPDSREIERVKQLRRCLLIHSYLYYVLDSAIVTDHQWQGWADELVNLQASGRYNDTDCYDAAFSDWDASTGYHLPRDAWIAEKALYVLRLHEKLKTKAPAWKTRGLIRKG